MGISLSTPKGQEPKLRVLSSSQKPEDGISEVDIPAGGERKSAVLSRFDSKPVDDFVGRVAEKVVSAIFSRFMSSPQPELPPALKSSAGTEHPRDRAEQLQIIEGQLTRTREMRGVPRDPSSAKFRELLNDLGLGNRAQETIVLPTAKAESFRELARKIGTQRSMLELARMINMPPAEILGLAKKLDLKLTDQERIKVNLNQPISVLPPEWRTGHSANFSNPRPPDLRLIGSLLNGFAEELGSMGGISIFKPKVGAIANESAVKLYELALRYDRAADKALDPRPLVESGWRDLKKVPLFQ